MGEPLRIRAEWDDDSFTFYLDDDALPSVKMVGDGRVARFYFEVGADTGQFVFTVDEFQIRYVV